MRNDLIIIGAGGHAKVIADIALKSGYDILGFLDDGKTGTFFGFPVLGSISDINKYSVKTIIAIGDNGLRAKIAKQFNADFAVLIHPSAQIASDVTLGAGTVVMANAVINASARIGKHCIINTGVVIEHDDVIGDYVHISPNATVCGTVKIGDMSHIGAGAVVKNNVSITDNTTVGIGAAVTKNIENPGIYVGIPVRKI